MAGEDDETRKTWQRRPKIHGQRKRRDKKYLAATPKNIWQAETARQAIRGSDAKNTLLAQTTGQEILGNDGKNAWVAKTTR